MEDAGLPPTVFPVVVSANSDPQEARLEAYEIHKYLLAKSYFDCREFERCAAVFLPSTVPKGSLSVSSPNVSTRSPLKSAKGKSKDTKATTGGPTTGSIPPPNVLPRLSQKSLFLALYAKYMSGEKKKDEESEMILGPADRGSAMNKELVQISRSLEGWFATRRPDQSSGGWLEYLYGIVLAKGKNEEDAKRWLIRSVYLFPYNWGTWLELNDLLGSVEEVRMSSPKTPLKSPISAAASPHRARAPSERDDFGVSFVRESRTIPIHRADPPPAERAAKGVPSESLSHDSKSTALLPLKGFLALSVPCLKHDAKDLLDFDEAESIFSNILHSDPHRIDSLDHYSNILYVMSARPKLAFVAQLATATDKFRPETCCVVGNYYSLKSEHEKAVQYFRRALTLDHNFLSAWTLMGHEYVEMKNTHAAIESYRRAVDVNRKDYRAWYGLGQTYEVLEMHLYALFYYQRASSLRPYDPKMWQAVGSCYDKIDRPVQSIKAYKRALVAGTYYDVGSSFGSGTTSDPPSGAMDPEIVYQIALVYEKLGELEEAAEYMEMTLAQEEGPVGEDEDGEEVRGAGTGVTNTTTKARMWLARWEYTHGAYSRAMELANELCQDGVEVEEAKALIRDVRARIEGEGAAGES